MNSACAVRFTNNQTSQEGKMPSSSEKILVEQSSPPQSSPPENREAIQKAGTGSVSGLVRAPPSLLPVEKPETSPPPTQVKVKVPPTSEKREGGRKKPKRMTPRRREIIAAFLLEVRANLGKFGNVGGSTWLNALLNRIRGESGRFDYIQVKDVMGWLNLAEFKGDYEKLLKLEKKLKATTSSSSSASALPMQNAEPIRSKKPVINAPPPPLQPAHFTIPTASSTTAQVANSQQQEPASILQGNCKGVDGGIIYQTQLPQNSNYFVNQKGLPILPDDLWRHIKAQEEKQQQQVQPEIFFQPGGILLQLPPSATTTTLYIQPATWAAYVAKFHETSGGTLATNGNGEEQLGSVKHEMSQDVNMKGEEEIARDDFAGDQFMGYMGDDKD